MLELASMTTPQPGPLRLLDEIGRGGSSIVYLGQLRDGFGGSHNVAVKVADEQLLKREFELARDVSSGSEHLITCRGAAEIAGSLVLLYDYVDGYTLAEIFRRRRATRYELAAIADGLGKALSYLAVRGIVHRDLSPANVFVDKTGRVLLGDLGHATRVGELCEDDACGTPGYNSPEQLANSALGPPSDAYSLGKLLAHLASGFSSPPGAKLPRKLGPSGRVIARLLVRDQERRLRADQIGALLSPQDIHRGRGTLATYAGGSERVPEFDGRWRHPVALRRWQYLSAVSLAITGILIALITIRSDEPPRQLAFEPMPDTRPVDSSQVPPASASNPSPASVRGSVAADEKRAAALTTHREPATASRPHEQNQTTTDDASRQGLPARPTSTTVSTSESGSASSSVRKAQSAYAGTQAMPASNNTQDDTSHTISKISQDLAQPTRSLKDIMLDERYLTDVASPTGEGYVAILLERQDDRQIVLSMHSTHQQLPYEVDLVDRAGHCQLGVYEVLPDHAQLTLIRNSQETCNFMLLLTFDVNGHPKTLRTSETITQ